jgi:hypothetical protein
VVSAVLEAEVLEEVVLAEAGKFRLKFRVFKFKVARLKDKAENHSCHVFSIYDFSVSKKIVCSRFGPTDAIVTGIPISSSIKLI